MISYPKVVRSALIGLIFTGLVSTCMSTQAVPQPVTKAGLASLFVIATISAYLALTQDEQPVLQNGNPFEKLVNWYRRVVCGQASKKTQIVQKDGTIKDTYSKASGMFGKTITWYDANEKDIKKSLGIGAIPLALAAGWITINNLSEILVQHALKAPYGETLAKISAK